MVQKSSVFVKIDNYREVLDVADDLRQQLTTVRETYDELQKLRNDEQQELAAWKEHLDAVEQQLRQVDKTLFEPEQ